MAEVNEELCSLSPGEAVRAFYHANDHPQGYRYVRLLDGPPEQVPEDQAAIGLSTGWIPATVAEEWRPEQLHDAYESRVLVRLHGRFADAYNQDPEQPIKGMYWRVRRSHVRSMGSQQPPAELSLFVVRWWDYWNPKNKRSRTYNVANEEMLLDVLEGPGSPHAMFYQRGGYEVHSAFIRNSSDLASLGPSIATAMRGKFQVGLYFLWPTQRPTVECRLPGAVAEPALLGLMGRMEAAGISTRWPHRAALYRELAGKLWVPRVSRERPELCVPPTVQLDLEKWKADPRAAAEGAIAELLRIRATQPDGLDPPADPFGGVVKLGFSWMGEDVRPFTGPAELVTALWSLLDGASPDAVCLIQERVEDVVCEIRQVCFQDLANGPEAVVKELVRMKLHPPRHLHDETFAMASHQTMTTQEAVDHAFYGSKEALKTAEQEAARLGKLWLQWFREEGGGTPASCRLDFLVSARKPQGGRGDPKVRLWTVELGECGASLCGVSPTVRAVSCLNGCLAGGDKRPQELPPLHPLPEPSAAGTSLARGGGRSSMAGQAGMAKVLRAAFSGTGARKVLTALLGILLLAFLRARRRR